VLAGARSTAARRGRRAHGRRPLSARTRIGTGQERMRVWIGLGVLAGVVGLALAFLARRASPSGSLHAGEVSENWLREHRAERDDPYTS
jgi:hypothetical protein